MVPQNRYSWICPKNCNLKYRSKVHGTTLLREHYYGYSVTRTINFKKDFLLNYLFNYSRLQMYIKPILADPQSWQLIYFFDCLFIVVGGELCELLVVS